MPVESKPSPHRAVTPKELAGKWTHQVDFGRPSEVELSNDGKAKNGPQSGTWHLSGDRLTIRWPSDDAPGKVWIDRLTVAYGGTYYAGRNSAGAVIRGARKGR